MKRSLYPYAALALILLVAALLRFYGLAWDGGYLFHPDERKIVLVASQLHFPSNPLEFLSPDSPLNPQFFAYGSFPIYLLRLLSMLAPSGPFDVPWREDNFVALGMLGRVLSGLFDLGSIGLVFLLGRRLFDATVGLLAAACLAVTVLAIQLAHFYAVDTLLTFLIVATVYFAARVAEKASRRDQIWMAVVFGLALATKVTAAPLIVPIVVALAHAHRRPASGASFSVRDETVQAKSRLEPIPVDGGVMPTALHLSRALEANVRLWQRVPALAGLRATMQEWGRALWSTRRALTTVLLVAGGVMVASQPYMVLDPVRYFGQVGTELLVARGWLDFPYTRQYADTLPFLYQIWQSSVWGMGVPLGLFAWIGSAIFAWHGWRSRDWRDGLILAWAAVYLLSIGGQYAKYLRYLLPLLPFMFLMASVAIVRRVRRPTSSRMRVAYILSGVLVLGSALAYSMAYISMYAYEHPWLQISRWIYQNVPAQSTIAGEYWDDSLPYPVKSGKLHAPSEYSIVQLPMYDPDTPEKLQSLVEDLSEADYVVLASQRLYATIPRLPIRYPVSTRYYRMLFAGSLGFEPVAFARNNPGLGSIVIEYDTLSDPELPVPAILQRPYPGISVWNWGKADESFVVYDHPIPIVFKRTRPLSQEELLRLLLQGR